PIARRPDFGPAPASRELAVLRSARGNDGEQPGADLSQRQATTFAAIAPLVTEREADVEKLEQVGVRARLREHRIEQREELVGPGRVTVQFRYQPLGGPVAPPRGSDGSVVERRAERIACDEAPVFGDACGLRSVLEGVELLAQPGSQANGIRMTQCVPDLRQGGEERIGGFDERIQAAKRGQISRTRLTVERRSKSELAGVSACDRENYGGV